jgi:hypothetical protein
MGLGCGIRDPGSGKTLFRIPDPGVKRHRIPDLDPQQESELQLVISDQAPGGHLISALQLSASVPN